MIAENTWIAHCVIRGCVPKQALFAYASYFSHDIADAAGFGWTVPPATFDWATLIANKDKEIARLEAAYTTNVEKSGVQVIVARRVRGPAYAGARRRQEGALEVYPDRHGRRTEPRQGHSRHRACHLIERRYFIYPNLPKRILIQGGGYIALEFVCIFSGLGSLVTVVYRGDNILRLRRRRPRPCPR